MSETIRSGQLEGGRLVCYGCAHAAGSEPYPGKPSGERPCGFCIRNPEREEILERIKKENGGELPANHPCLGVWYDGGPALKVPMDCYHSLDMKRQLTQWEGEAEREARRRTDAEKDGGQ